MNQQDPNERRRVDKAEQAVQRYRRCVDMALVVIGGVKDVHAAVSPLVADWTRRERRRVDAGEMPPRRS